MIPGIDVSSYQVDTDWRTVARCGQQFAFIKATEGVGYVNPQFARDRQGATDAGLAVGFYHFAQPEQNPDPVTEAHYFLENVAVLERGDILALDIESGAGPLQAWCTIWLRTVEREAGFKPLIYSGDWFMKPHQLEYNDDLAEYGLWLAAYQTTIPDPLPNWGFFAVWQYGQGPVPGVRGQCDLNLFNGDSVAQLRRYGKP